MNLIAQLDDYCLQHDGDRTLPNEYRTGPFGVFEAKRAKPSTRTAKQTVTDDTTTTGSVGTSIVVEAAIDVEDHTVPFEITDSEPLISIPLDPSSNGSSVEEIEHVRELDIFGSADGMSSNVVQAMPNQDFWQMDDPFSFMGDFGLAMDMPITDFLNVDHLGPGSTGYNMDGLTGLFDSNDDVAEPSAPLPKSHADWAYLLAEAPLLLRSYQTNSDASEPAKQSFWKSFVLPSAMRTFADLSVFGKANDVSSSVFYSTLANSAFAMQRSKPLPSEGLHWYSVGKSAEEAAQYYLQSAMRLEATQADCQELLSATLSVGLVSVSLLSDKGILRLLILNLVVSRTGQNNDTLDRS